MNTKLALRVVRLVFVSLSLAGCAGLCAKPPACGQSQASVQIQVAPAVGIDGNLTVGAKLTDGQEPAVGTVDYETCRKQQIAKACGELRKTVQNSMLSDPATVRDTGSNSIEGLVPSSGSQYLFVLPDEVKAAYIAVKLAEMARDYGLYDFAQHERFAWPGLACGAMNQKN